MRISPTYLRGLKGMRAWRGSFSAARLAAGGGIVVTCSAGTRVVKPACGTGSPFSPSGIWGCRRGVEITLPYTSLGTSRSGSHYHLPPIFLGMQMGMCAGQEARRQFFWPAIEQMILEYTNRGYGSVSIQLRLSAKIPSVPAKVGSTHRRQCNLWEK